MVFVDFGNAWIRWYYEKRFLQRHHTALDRIRCKLPDWVRATRIAENDYALQHEVSPRPLAVVFDIDEVLLCNMHMNTAMLPDGRTYYAADLFGWKRGAVLNPILPGAIQLVAAARLLGLKIFMITGRRTDLRDETIENFDLVGLSEYFDREALTVTDVSADAPLHLRPPDHEGPVRPYKEERRRIISERYRIVANIGDQASDLGCYGDIQCLLPHPFYYIE